MIRVFYEGKIGLGSREHALLSSSVEIIETENPTEADVIFFTGGEDIDPIFYNDSPIHKTNTNPNRDSICLKLWDIGKDRKKFIGICRGAQFLAAMSGAKLAQDMQHPASHAVTDSRTGETFHVNSAHHQAIMPCGSLGKIVHLGPRAKCLFGNGSESWAYNVETFITPNIFAVQWHPEWLSRNWGKQDKCVEWWKKEVKRWLCVG